MKKSLKFIIILSLLLLIFPLFSQIASAEVGDFYNDNKEKIDDTFPKSTIDLIKKYDREANDFDCGFMEISCEINGGFWTMAIGFVLVLYESNNAAVNPYDIINNSTFSTYKEGLKTLSWTMLSLFLLWHVTKMVAYRYADSEDGMVSLNDKLVKLVSLAILLGTYEPFFTTIMNFQYEAVQAVFDAGFNVDDLIFTVIYYTGFYGIIMGFVVGIIMFIFQIAFTYRFVLFALLYIVGVIAIPTGMNEEYNYFSLWLRIIISNAVTLFLQALAFTLGFNSLFNLDNASFFNAMAFFVLALTIPSLLGQLGASSGTSRAMGSIIRAVVRRR